MVRGRQRQSSSKPFARPATIELTHTSFREGFRVEPLLLHPERSQVRWLGSLLDFSLVRISRHIQQSRYAHLPSMVSGFLMSLKRCPTFCAYSNLCKLFKKKPPQAPHSNNLLFYVYFADNFGHSCGFRFLYFNKSFCNNRAQLCHV